MNVETMHISMTGSCVSPGKHQAHLDEDKYGMQYYTNMFPCIFCTQLVCTPYSDDHQRVATSAASCLPVSDKTLIPSNDIHTFLMEIIMQLDVCQKCFR